jgi:hypothetical protein
MLALFLPFNHKYFDVGTVKNAVASSVSVEIWWANAWHAAVDILDRTKLVSASLSQSEVIQWNTDRLKGWDRELDSSDVTGLTGTKIYNMYWARFSWNATLTSTMALQFIGPRFSSDSILFTYYPDLNNSQLMTSFESGKTEWFIQHFMAAEVIVRDLIRTGVIISPAQIMDHDRFTEAACHKVAEIIYQALGDAYKDNKAEARKMYKETMDLKLFNLDVTQDGSLQLEERGISQGWLHR